MTGAPDYDMERDDGTRLTLINKRYVTSDLLEVSRALQRESLRSAFRRSCSETIIFGLCYCH